MQSTKARQAYSLILKITILILTLLGQYVSARQNNFMSGNHFLYYTNQSNILVFLLMALLLPYEIKSAAKNKAANMPDFLLKLRFSITSAIFLTFVGFSVLLLPFQPKDYLLSPANLLVHNAVPILACADFILFPTGDKKPKVLLGLICPTMYFVFIIIVGQTGHRFFGSVAPYFFLDYEKLGWIKFSGAKIGVIYWMIFMGAVQTGLSTLLIRLQAKVLNKIEGEQCEG